MRVAVFSTKPYDRTFLEAANRSHDHALTFFEPRLTSATARLAEGHAAACLFVNDVASAEVLQHLAAGGTRMLALRSAGFNHVDLAAAARHGFTVARVPAYSPHAVAEHTVGLMLALNRHVHRAYNRVREGNFALDGLLGFDMRGKTVGVVGTGKIGAIVAQIVHGFGCDILAYDLAEHPGCVALGARYVPLDALLARSDIITLHCPLTPQTYHLIDGAALARMRPGAMLVNTSRGALLDAQAAIEALKSGQLSGARCLRGGGRSVLRGPVEPGAARRCLRPPADVPECDHHRPSGVLHTDGPDGDRRDHHGEPDGVCCRAGARQSGAAAVSHAS